MTTATTQDVYVVEWPEGNADVFLDSAQAARCYHDQPDLVSHAAHGGRVIPIETALRDYPPGPVNSWGPAILSNLEIHRPKIRWQDVVVLGSDYETVIDGPERFGALSELRETGTMAGYFLPPVEGQVVDEGEEWKAGPGRQDIDWTGFPSDFRLIPCPNDDPGIPSDIALQITAVRWATEAPEVYRVYIPGETGESRWVIWIPEEGRGGVAHGGPSIWTDAAGPEDVFLRYVEGRMIH